MSYGPVTWADAESVLEPIDGKGEDKFWCPLCGDTSYGTLYLNESNTGEDDVFVYSFCDCDNFEIKDWIRDRLEGYVNIDWPGGLPPKRQEPERRFRKGGSNLIDDQFDFDEELVRWHGLTG